MVSRTHNRRDPRSSGIDAYRVALSCEAAGLPDDLGRSLGRARQDPSSALSRSLVPMIRTEDRTLSVLVRTHAASIQASTPPCSPAKPRRLPWRKGRPVRNGSSAPIGRPVPLGRVRRGPPPLPWRWQ